MTSPVTIRYFNTYSGVKLPFRLTAELGAAEIANRNTYFRGEFDAAGTLLGFEKRVYDEVELAHRYNYGEDGSLLRAEISDADGEVTVVETA